MEYIDLSYMNRENVDEAVIKLQDALYVSNFKEEVNESYNPVNQKRDRTTLDFFKKVTIALLGVLILFILYT